jgi:hypothetical protein
MATLKNTVINASNNITVGNNSQTTVAGTAKLRFNTTNSQNTLEFYDAGGWRPVTGYSASTVGTGGDSISYIPGGGIVHAFTSVTSAVFTPTFTGNVQVLVVAGGGGGGSSWGGGGGGGGVILQRNYAVTSGVGIPLSVGGGGSHGPGNTGGNSVFGSLTASGGGSGGTWTHSSPGQMGTYTAGNPGGSGGGGTNTGDGIDSRTRSYGGLGTAGQGFPAGSGVRFNVDSENCHHGGSGGGAGGPGACAPDGRQNYRGGFRSDNMTGGAGRATDILGQHLYFAGGGGGGSHLGYGYNDGGIGGGGGGGRHHASNYGGAPHQGRGGGQSLNDGQQCNVHVGGGSGGANTGGGGGAHGSSGGSGIVVVRY